jgi:hypothetical protein
MSSIPCEKDPTTTVLFCHTCTQLKGREPCEVAETDAGQTDPFVKEALKGFECWGWPHLALIGRKICREEPGALMDHWLQRQSPDWAIRPEMPVIGIEPKDLHVGDDVRWVIKILTLERDASAGAHCAMPSIAADQITSPDRFALACMYHLSHEMVGVLREASKLAVPFYMQAKG